MADGEEPQEQQKKQNQQAAALEKLTDYVEEQEIKSEDLNKAINALSTKHQLEDEKKAERERQLASVKIKKEDVDLIVSEMEVTKIRAERVLREQNGNPVLALRYLMNTA
jgi:NACalpha-BTF3-like transcription factor